MYDLGAWVVLAMLALALRPTSLLLATGLLVGPMVPLVALPLFADPGGPVDGDTTILAPPEASPTGLTVHQTLGGPTVWSYAFVVSDDNDLSGHIRVKGVTVQGDDLTTKVRWTQTFILLDDEIHFGAGGGDVSDPALLHMQKGDTHLATPGYGGLMGNIGSSGIPFRADNHSGLVQVVVFTSHASLDIDMDAEWSRGVVRHGVHQGDASDVVMRTMTDMDGGDHHGIQALGSQGSDLHMSFGTRHGLVGWFFGERPGHRIDWSCNAPPGSHGCPDRHGDHVHDHPLNRLVSRSPGPWKFQVHEVEDDIEQDPLLLVAARLPDPGDHDWRPGHLS